MEEALLVEAIMDTRAQLDFLWHFFVTVQIAIFALLFVYDEAVDNLNRLARILAVLGVALFEWVNANAILDTYQLLDALHGQYRAVFGSPGRFQAALYQQFVLATYSGRETLVAITHGSAFAVVLLALIWRHFVYRRAVGRKADA